MQRSNDTSKLKEIVKQLRAEVRELKRKNKKLLGEIKTLEEAFKESVNFIKQEFTDLPLHKVLKYVKYVEKKTNNKKKNKRRR